MMITTQTYTHTHSFMKLNIKMSASIKQKKSQKEKLLKRHHVKTMWVTLFDGCVCVCVLFSLTECVIVLFLLFFFSLCSWPLLQVLISFFLFCFFLHPYDDDDDCFDIQWYQLLHNINSFVCAILYSVLCFVDFIVFTCGYIIGIYLFFFQNQFPISRSPLHSDLWLDWSLIVLVVSSLSLSLNVLYECII